METKALCDIPLVSPSSLNKFFPKTIRMFSFHEIDKKYQNQNKMDSSKCKKVFSYSEDRRRDIFGPNFCGDSPSSSRISENSSGILRLQHYNKIFNYQYWY